MTVKEHEYGKAKECILCSHALTAWTVATMHDVHDTSMTRPNNLGREGCIFVTSESPNA